MFIVWLSQPSCRHALRSVNMPRTYCRCSNSTINRQSVRTFTLSSRRSKNQTHGVRAPYITIKQSLAGCCHQKCARSRLPEMKNKWNTLRLSWFPSRPVTPSVTPGDLFWARVLSCMTSITARKMNEVGLVSVLCLLCAKAAGAPKHREHLQTESNEAAGRTAAHPPNTNQSS